MFFQRLLIVSLTILVCSVNLGRAATLPADELDALKQIGKTLGKEWNFSVDPCSGGGNWITPNAPKGYNNTVTCNCSYESNTICHVVSIDLSRNYLNGTIPPEWGTMEQLVNISLLGNRITGPIPGELSNISTLENL
ncbi:putative leucine-rich repeat receptor-like serine/threonine-protein kinase [Forsythia ovata]|uniref:Leucine-rich repeat receptor-like serine/threonine-protein kinase n=1 Tax=Forsythia ovata TaxID=205694 RepID=A0ABD1NUG3_9LAMI